MDDLRGQLQAAVDLLESWTGMSREKVNTALACRVADNRKKASDATATR